MTATSVPRPSTWLAATVASIREETRRVKTIRFTAAGWPGHLPGQHADVRLTANDGYRAERSYSIASPPADSAIELTIDRLEDGEVSPFLTDRLQPGDTVGLRGPIGGHFVWSGEHPRPLLLVGGGAGIVPLMCMLRHRRRGGGRTPAALLYSVRTREDIIYRHELATLVEHDRLLTLHVTLTRDVEPGWAGHRGRIGLATVEATLAHLGSGADCFVCGTDGFVEAASTLLVRAGYPADMIRTERFGPG